MKKKLLMLLTLALCWQGTFALTWSTIDDLDLAWNWTNFWKADRAGTYGGTQHGNDHVGDSAECTFTGSSVEAYGEIWVGSGGFEIFIDGVSKGSYSLSFTPESKSGKFATITGLSEGEHTIKFVANGLWGGIDYIKVGTTEVYWNTIDDLDLAWNWTNFWKADRAGTYGGTQHGNDHVGDSAECTFTGSSVEAYGEIWVGSGGFEIFIDGISKGAFSLSFTPESKSGKFATITGLSEGEHTIKFVANGLWGGIDYIKVGTTVSLQAPSATVGVTATFVSPNVKLDWTTTDLATGYKIMRKTSSDGIFAEIATISDGLVTKYTDNAIESSTQYFYTIKAFNTNGDAPMSDEVNVNVPVLPDYVIYVSSEGTEWGETREKLVDGNLNNKWGSSEMPLWFVFKYDEAKTWGRYALTSANDNPGRDLKDWTLTGSNDSTTWDTLDIQAGHPVWEARNSTIKFGFTNATAYTYYKFDITANNGDGYTQLSEIEFMVKPTTAPDSATGIAAEVISATQINITWNVNDKATGYTVWRKAGAASAWAELGDVSVLKFEDKTVVANNNYFYKVVAWNDIKDAPASIEVNASTYEIHWSTIDDLDLAWNWTNFWKADRAGTYGGTQHGNDHVGDWAECTFTGSSVEAYGEIWVGSGGFEIFIDGVSKGAFSLSFTPVSKSGKFATITGLSEGEHTIKFVANGLWGGIDYIKVGTTVVRQAPGATVGVTATFVSPNVKLSWTATDSAAGYVIKRREGTLITTYNVIDTVIGGNIVSYDDTTTLPNKKYYYIIVAFNADGSAPNSDWVVINVPAKSDTVTGLTATSTVFNKVLLKWTITGFTDGYNIYRKNSDNGTFAVVGNVTESSIVNFTDTTVVGSTTYIYKVAAYNKRGEGGASNEVTVATSAKPATAIANNTTGGVSMYPNPVVNGTLNIKSASESATITITDIMGKTVLVQVVNKSTVAINVSGLQSGMYVVNYSTQTNSLSQKLIIK